MYELNRVRLHSIGPATARYQDVVLDFRDVGLPVSKPARQENLFTRGEVVRRPSPASVLFLENGGGKSVLIKLIFSVILPGRRQVVGTTNTHVLENFVGARDVAHVVLEWQHTLTGHRVITGKVSEWRGHAVSSDPSKLIDRWYSFRPTASLDLDSVPFTQDGRLVTLTGFQDRLYEAHRRDPAMQLVWEKNQSDWTEHLVNLGLDPELFRYQRAMNAGEGEAAEAFKFKTDQEFVDFLLKAVTAEEDPRGLGELLGNYAVRLAERGALQDERDFVAGALERMAPLAMLESEAETARGIARREHMAGERFAAEIEVRRDHEAELLETLRSHLAEAKEQEQKADQEQDRLQSVVSELRRLVAELRLREAEHRKKDIEDQLAEAKRTLSAWHNVPVELRFRAARDTTARLRDLVEQQEQRAQPALLAMDRAARRLVRSLLALAAKADEEAARLDALAEASQVRAKQAQDAHNDAVREEERQLAQKTQADNKVAQVRGAVEEQVRAGVLTEGADLVREADSAADEATSAEQEAVTVDDRLTSLREQRDAVLGEVIAAERTLTGAQSALKTATGRVKEAADRDAELTGNARLIELLGSDTVRLDTDTPVLLTRIAEAEEAAEAEQLALREQNAVDERALEALGAGGLLPPSDDVVRALEVLESCRIPAWSGWRYLANLSPEDQEQVLAAFPHLVGGIVLNSAGHYERAEQVLAEALLLPRSIVAVGNTAAMLQRDAAPPQGIGFVVPPNPAMYDEEAAESERATIQSRHAERSARIHALRRQLRADRGLHALLQAWQRDYPPGTVERLATEKAEAEQALEEAERRLAKARSAAEEIAAEEQSLQKRLPELRKRASDCRTRAELLAELAKQASQIPGWLQDSATAQQRADEARRNAAQAAASAEQRRGKAAEYRRTADDHRRTAAASRSEIGEIPGGGDVTEMEPVPGDPVDILRTAYRSATEEYQKVQVGSDLLAELDSAQRKEADARSEVERLPEVERGLIAELLTGPDSGDRAAMAAATERAKRRVDSLESELRDATLDVGSLSEKYNTLKPQERSLQPYGRPTDIAHGEQLIQRALADWRAASARYVELRNLRVGLDQRVAAAEENFNGFDSLAEALVDLSPAAPDPDIPPYSGTLDYARARLKALRTALAEANQLLQEAEAAVRQAANELSRYAAEQRFEKVNSHVRRQLLAVGVDRLPHYAEEWTQALRPRLRTLTDDLSQIEIHRANIITRLQGMVENALATLRSAQRLSRLPDHLGDWSGQEFLRVKFEDVDENVLADRLGEVVDEASAKDGQARKRDGMTLLLDGVRAAMPKGVRVEILKPDTVLRTERTRVSEIHEVFSGGQELTTAIILYCTMAALRANDRGQGRQKHSGVLFLDNPIGRASAGYLLELQLKVARPLGVQLIYTTGLFDTDALSVFPLIVRLRNDADLRKGMKYLSMDSEIRRPLEELGEHDGTGRLSATRLFTRQAAR